jgi:hypothetical protein
VTDTAAGEEATSGRPAEGISPVLRFATELVAWVATPWALADRSWLLAAFSVVVLIGLPTLFSTPGDKPHVLVAVSGRVTILLVALQIAAAVVSSWLAWSAWAAGWVTLLAAATCVTERRRWRWLASVGRSGPAGRSGSIPG